MTVTALLAAMALFAGWLVWRTARRARDYLAIAALTLLVAPLLAMSLTGDMSRYFPRSFSDGPEGVGEIVLASALATLLIAVILAALLWSLVRLCWRRVA